MQHLFQNLISNAVKFRKENETPHVVISSQAAADSKSVAVSVQDNGIGFDEKYKERIFKPFERLHGPGRYEGNGIGLAICQKIVSDHDARIFVQSAPGQGSRFTVTLPLFQEEAGR